jgi:hypothetical protein
MQMRSIMRKTVLNRTKHAVSTPVNWKPGEDVVVPAAMSEEDVKAKFPNGLKTLKPYLRLGSHPR